MRLVMQQDQRPSDLLVPQGCQPSGFGGVNIFIQIGADSLHEQNVSQSCDNRRGATAARSQLLKDMADRRSEPRGSVFASSLEMDKRRENRKKRVGRAILRSHPATHQSRNRSRAPGAKRPLFVRSAALEKVEIINNRSCWKIPHDVRVTSRHDYEIAGAQLYRLGHAVDSDPALSMSEDVKSRPSNIDAEAPWRAKLGPVVGAGSKTDRMQKAVDQGFAPNLSSDIHCSIYLLISTQTWNVIVLYLATSSSTPRLGPSSRCGSPNCLISMVSRMRSGTSAANKDRAFASRPTRYRGFGFGAVSASNTFVATLSGEMPVWPNLVKAAFAAALAVAYNLPAASTLPSFIPARRWGFDHKGVATGPGSISETCIPQGRSSMRNASVRPSSANFDAL